MQTVPQLIEEIAPYLTVLDPNLDWYVELCKMSSGTIDDSRAYLVSNQGHVFFCVSRSWTNSEAKRIHISPSSLKYANGRYFTTPPQRPCPSISVSRTRKPDALARDFYRRVIPQGVEWIETSKAIIKEWDKKEAKKDQHKELIAQLCQRQLIGHDKDRICDNGWEARITSSYGVMELKLTYVDPETAVDLIKAYQAAGGPTCRSF